MARSGMTILMSASLVVSATMTMAASLPPERGSGPFPALFEERVSLPDHVVYRPAKPGRDPLPVYIFGNGGCSADGTSSRNHLLEIASHGYLVIASGTVPKAGPKPGATGGPLQAQTATHLMTDAIDWVARENVRPGSPLRGRIATDRIAVSGWSCGGLQALTIGSDPRVRTVVAMNTGFFNDGKSPIPGIVSDKALLGRLHTPVLYVLGGPDDIAHANGSDDFRRLQAVPAALVDIPVGHGGTYMQPHGGLAAQVVTQWLDWQLKGDGKARARFAGPDCGWCRDTRLTITRNAAL